jgi:hypothetical protein
MSRITNQTLPSQQFTPTTVEEYLALQLAKRLSDEQGVRRYIRYTEHYPAKHLLHLVHQASQESDPANAFHSFLTPSNS